MTRLIDHTNTMASTARKPPSLSNPKPSGRSRLVHDTTLKTGASSRLTPIAGLSPEARAAMSLAREDTKDSMQLRSRHASLPRINSNSSLTNKKSGNTNTGNNNNLNTNLATSPGDKDNVTGSCGLTPHVRSSRSRTTTSEFNDSGISSVKRQAPSSGKTTTTTTTGSAMTKDGVSNFNDIYDADNSNNNNNNNTVNHNNSSNVESGIHQRRGQLRPLSRISRSQTPSSRRKPQYGSDRLEDDASIDNGFSPTLTSANANTLLQAHAGSESSTQITKEKSPSSNMNSKGENAKSFVLALDAAFEANCISRLRGDITDLNTDNSAAPGTVRALNGGRLSNAQEVVVNVFHGDCEKELVFHDDDLESLDTARAASDIRVNTWLEYNQDFPPDDVDYLDLDESGVGASEVEGRSKTLASQTPSSTTAKSKSTTSGATPTNKSTLRVPTARVRSAQVATQPPSSNRLGNKPPIASRKDSNNNYNSINAKSSTSNNTTTDAGSSNAAQKNSSAGSARSKSGTNGSLRDNSSSRFGSAISNDSSSRRGANSPAMKKQSYLSRKAKV